MIVPPVITDKLGRTIHVVTDTANRAGVLRAERCDRLAIVVRKSISPIRRADGKRVSYIVETMTLSADGDNELACVQGNEFSYLSAKELGPYLRGGQPLFNFLTV